VRVLVIGSGGMLGNAVSSALSGKVHLLTHSRPPDITSMLEVDEFFQASFHPFKPDFVINCAAYTNVDKAEQEKQECFFVNAIGPFNLAMICGIFGAKLVHISSDFVFSGNRGNYSEDDVPHPINWYGNSKLSGEYRIPRDKHYILRTAWLFGPGRQNFVTRIWDKFCREEKALVTWEIMGSPTYTVDLASAIVELIEKKPPLGIYHVTNEGGIASKLSFAQEIENNFFKIKRKYGTVESLDHVPDTPAFRPRNTSLSTQKWRDAGMTPLRSWREALREFLEKYSQDFQALPTANSSVIQKE
jgi:dTDP-4-dehydrorhamnose reductase